MAALGRLLDELTVAVAQCRLRMCGRQRRSRVPLPRVKAQALLSRRMSISSCPSSRPTAPWYFCSRQPTVPARGARTALRRYERQELRRALCLKGRRHGLGIREAGYGQPRRDRDRRGGGVEAVTKLARGLPADLPAAVLVAIHRGLDGGPTGQSRLPTAWPGEPGSMEEIFRFWRVRLVYGAASGEVIGGTCPTAICGPAASAGRWRRAVRPKRSPSGTARARRRSSAPCLCGR